MSDTELTVSHPLWIKVDLKGLDFNGLVRAIVEVAARACGELLGQAMRAVEKGAREREPGRWVHRGQPTRRLRLPWGETTVRRTRVRDQRTGQTYHLADRLLGLPPKVRRGAHEVQTACELAASMSYRQAVHWWGRLTPKAIRAGPLRGPPLGAAQPVTALPEAAIPSVFQTTGVERRRCQKWHVEL